MFCDVYILKINNKPIQGGDIITAVVYTGCNSCIQRDVNFEHCLLGDIFCCDTLTNKSAQVI